MESSVAWIKSKTIESSLLGRALRTSSKTKGNTHEEIGEVAPVFKYRLGDEPTSPRPGSPGFQDEHWVSPLVVLRPNLQ